MFQRQIADSVASSALPDVVPCIEMMQCMLHANDLIWFEREAPAVCKDWSCRFTEQPVRSLPWTANVLLWGEQLGRSC